jgi:hypothetical protein
MLLSILSNYLSVDLDAHHPDLSLPSMVWHHLYIRRRYRNGSLKQDHAASISLHAVPVAARSAQSSSILPCICDPGFAGKL